MKALFMLMLLVSTSAFAKEEWLCTEASSQRRGNSILACGVGEGRDESQARTKALDNSKQEFTKLCELSDDCKNHLITVQPERTTCEKDKRNYRCYRLIVFTIDEGKKRESINPNLKSEGSEGTEGFGSFSYNEIKHLPKIKIGMSKAELLKSFGPPKRVVPIRMPHLKIWEVSGSQYLYEGPMCNQEYFSDLEYNLGDAGKYRSGQCGVGIHSDEVVYIQNFHYDYTEDLK